MFLLNILYVYFLQSGYKVFQPHLHHHLQAEVKSMRPDTATGYKPMYPTAYFAPNFCRTRSEISSFVDMNIIVGSADLSFTTS